MMDLGPGTASAKVVEITDDNFAELVQRSAKPFLLDFSAKWCRPCQALLPTVEAIAHDRSEQIAVGRLDIDASPDVTAKYGVCSMPTLMLFKNGQPVGGLVGNLPRSEIDSLIDPYL